MDFKTQLLIKSLNELDRLEARRKQLIQEHDAVIKQRKKYIRELVEDIMKGQTELDI
jgi:hypothetical protein